MAHHRIELPIEDFTTFQEIARKVHEREIDPEQAAYEVREVLAPHVTMMPGPDDTTEVVLRPKTRAWLGGTNPFALTRRHPLS